MSTHFAIHEYFLVLASVSNVHVCINEESQYPIIIILLLVLLCISLQTDMNGYYNHEDCENAETISFGMPFLN